MIQKIVAWAGLVLVVILQLSLNRVLEAQQRTPQVVSFCQLVARSDQFLEKEVAIQVRVKTYRHGTSISDDACPKNTFLLKPSHSAEQASSVSHFYQFLGQHRQSSKPIFATITGHLVKGSTSGFVLRRDFDFELDSVSDFSEGDKVGGP